ncbi:MAG: hypothetical protein OQL19_11140 [Gammaproteobacteria bacterium]|nr:hypothetical protein [Gammaproteobacteria bacterium]
MAFPTDLFDESRVCYFLEAPLKMRLMLLYVAISAFVLVLFYLINYWSSTNLSHILFATSFILAFILIALWRHVVIIDLNKQVLEIHNGFLFPSLEKKLDIKDFTHIGTRCRCIGLLMAPGSRFVTYLYNKKGHRIDITSSRTRQDSRKQAHQLARTLASITQIKQQ